MDNTYKFCSVTYKPKVCAGAPVNKKSYFDPDFNRADVGIIGAVATEIEVIKKSLEIQFPSVSYAGRLFLRGVYQKLYIIIVVSGIGMTNAAMTAQMMIDKFKPRCIIYTGIAGGMNPSIVPGTVVIPRRAGQYRFQKANPSLINQTGLTNLFIDNSVDFPDKFFRYDTNKVVSFNRPNCIGCANQTIVPNINTIVDGRVVTSGMEIPMQIESFLEPIDAYLEPPPTKFFFQMDELLLSFSEKVVSSGVELPCQICTQLNICYTPQIRIVDFEGSASTFLNNAEYRTILYLMFREAGVSFDLVDMEGAGVAHVAYSNSTPFLVVKSVSDLAGRSASSQNQNFTTAAICNASFVVLEILKLLGQNKSECHYWESR